MKCLCGHIIKGLEPLIVLDVSHTKLEEIDYRFANFTGLKEFYLSDNKLFKMTEALSLAAKIAPNVEILDLSRNGFIYLPIDTFKHLSLLRKLYLAGNELTSISFMGTDFSLLTILINCVLQ